MKISLGPREYTLGATALGSSLAFIDASAVIVALPTMQKSLHLGLAGEQWIYLAYSLALASLYLIGGSLGDRFGHRRVFRRGIVGFALASIMAGVAPSGFWIILARVLQGVSGAFVTTNSLAWLRTVYGKEAGKAVGLWTSLTGISTIAAPLLGGALTQYVNWRWIFFINLPLAAVVIYWSTKAQADTGTGTSEKPLDFIGSGLVAVSFGFLTYFLVQGAKTGFKELLWSLVIGLLALGGFVVAELKVKHPMLPFKFFKIRNFLFANLETFLMYGALNGLLVYFTLYLQFLGLSPVGSSVFLIPTSIIMILLAAKFGMLADRYGPKYLLTAGPALIGVAAFIFSLIKTKNDIWLLGSMGVVLFSLGLAMLVAPITAAALKSLPSKFSGLASGVNNTMSRTGGLVAVAVIGMVISITFLGSTHDKGAVPLAKDETSQSLRAASVHSFQKGAWIISVLAFSAASVGLLGITNKIEPEEIEL